jgi:RNA polymerase sigma-70 factor (ECF subfamily)
VRWTGQAARLAAWGAEDAPNGEGAPEHPDALTEAAPASPSATQSASVEDAVTFTHLLDAHSATLIRVAAALVGLSDAEDAAQEAVVRAWRAWPGLRAQAAARSWLISITINVCRDWLRGSFGTRRRVTESLLGDDAEPRPFAQIDADPGASDYALALDLRQAITTLDEDLRTVVALRYYAGMDSTTIGVALGIPAATVRTRLRRALSLLREQLSAAHIPPTDPEGRR